MKLYFHDLLDLAINLEREGAEFYDSLSQKAKNKSTKEIFKNFASDELKHAQTFLELKESDPAGENVLVDDSLSELIGQIKQEDVLPQVPENDAKNIHPLTAIKLGIKSEKNAVKLYKQILKRVKSDEGRKVIEALINEEKNHAAELTEMHKNKTFDF